MRLLSVTVRNYRLHRELTVEFDPSRTLVGGPNEAGKSTIVEAIHRALFLKAKGNTEIHRAMTSSLHAGHPEVELTFEAQGGVHVLKKRFGSAGTATLLSPKTALLSGDAAEARLANLVGLKEPATGRAAALQWGHLWIWQGGAGEDPCGHATQQRDGLLQRLQSMGSAGALQSELDARVASHFAEAQSAIFTQAGKSKAGSELERAESAAESAAEEVATASARVARLDSAATEFETATRTLADAIATLGELEKERERTDARVQELAALRQKESEQLHAVKAAATVLAAQESADQQIHKMRTDIAESAGKLEPLDEMIARLQSDQDAAQERAASAGQVLQKAAESARASRLRHDWARACLELFEKRDVRSKLDGQFEKITLRKRELRELEEQFAKLPAVDKTKLRKLQQLEVACSNAQAALRAVATGLEIIFASDPVTANGRAFASGERQIFTEETEIAVGKHTRLRIQPGGGTSLAEARAAEAQAQSTLRENLDAAGLATVSEAGEIATRRDDIGAKIKTVQAELTGLGAANIEQELQLARNELAGAEATVERRAGLIESPIPPAAKPAAIALAKELERSARENDDAEKQAKVQHDTSSTALDAVKKRLAAMRAETQQQRDSLTGLKAQLELLLKTHGADEQRAAVLLERQTARTSAELLLKTTKDAIAQLQPDLLPADRQRIARAIEVRKVERDDARVKIGIAQDALRSDGHDDPQATLAAARAKARSANEHRDSVRRKADALALLDELFRDEQRTLASQFTQPLADRISGYLQCIFGAGASAHVQLENNEFGGLRLSRAASASDSFAFDSLSGGTREQTAAAVRLAVAELLAADHDGCLPIIFDDAFAHSDPDRVNQLQRMLDLAATRGLQVIILTCNPGDYSALGAKQITLSRSPTPAS